MQGFELAAPLVPPLRIFKTSFGGLGGPQGTPQEGENAPSSLLPSAVESPNRIPAFLPGIMPPRGLLPCKNAGILAAHGTPLKCRESGLLPSTGHFGPPSDDLDASKHFFKKAFQLRTFFLAAFWLPSRWSRDTVEMQGIELATLFGAPSAFQQFCEKDPRTLVGVFSVLCEVFAGHRRNAGIRACGYFGAPIGFS